jgi:outer membrane protein
MRGVRRTGLFFVLLMGIPCLLQAETISLTLQQAIGLGLKNSTSIRQKMLKVASAGADLQSAKAARYTTVSASLSYSHLFEQPKMEDTTFDFGQGPLTIPGMYLSAQDPIMLELNANQAIYTFGKIKTGIQLAEEGMGVARLELEEEKRSLIVKIKRAFYGYILAKEVVAVQEETLANKEEALNIAKKRYDAGLGSELDVLSAESDVENFTPEVLSAQNRVKFAILAVMDLLGIESKGNEKYDVKLVGELKPEYHRFDRDELIKTAMKKNYNIQQYRFGINAAEYQKNLASRAKLPTIAGFANYTVQSGYDATTGKNEYTGAGSWSDLLTVGVGVQMPLSALFPWSGENAGAKKAEFDAESMTTGLSSIESGIRLSIQNILLSLDQENAKIASGKKQVEVARKLLTTSKASYENGLISNMRLKDAQLGLNAAELGYLSAIYNYNMALYDLYDAIGVDSL